MKIHPLFPFLLVAGLWTITDVVHADKWAPPKSRIFASPWGNHGFKMLLPKFGGQSQGVLFELNTDGKEAVIWDKMLVNIPHQVFVADHPKHVVTIDTYGNLGYAHALVLYDEKGNVLKDYALEDLLTVDEIKTKVLHTEGSRRWAEGAKFGFENGHFVARLSWGRTIHVNLQTGKLAM